MSANNKKHIYRQRNLEYIQHLKSKTPCHECGNQYQPQQMEFEPAAWLPGGTIRALALQPAGIERINQVASLLSCYCFNCRPLLFQLTVRTTSIANTMIEVVLSRVSVQANGCWEWTGPTTETGHPSQSFKNHKTLVHRWIYNLLVGDIDNGLKLHHLCENPPCINPSHLTPVTQHLHMMLTPNNPAKINKLKTHCIHGHELSEDNIRLGTKNGAPIRNCKACNREAVSRCAEKKKASIGGKWD